MKTNIILYFAMTCAICIFINTINGSPTELKREIKREEQEPQLYDFVKRIIPAVDPTPKCDTTTTCKKLTDCPQPACTACNDKGYCAGPK